MTRRGAFTLIEVLVSILLISLVLLGLYRSLDIQRASNRNLHKHLQKAMNQDRAVMVLYRDLLSSDGNLTLVKGEYDRLCINQTRHTLYDLPHPRVCWLVLKEGRVLVRVEGGDYRLPLRGGDRVAIDRVMGPMSLFDITRRQGEILVALQQEGKEPYTFLLQGIAPPKLPPKPKKKTPPKPVKKAPPTNRPPTHQGAPHDNQEGGT
jgi:prepilin-type N-terminal cleavage/methylation domain-containing protein